ncbi:terminase family protein [Kingella negevensis]|uniref:Terminase-like family protein n=1 Tax=Kingella negevensis TaxID=1522312 RepID=A0A238HHE7_9NEIS|nr:terminase family protein [Kingella negevensis]MDK4685431.1 terminase family protein [Kingella negevensis]MDK4697987.1 terminase family protein [Kingella negevensis]SNB81003.1 Terminase-like family protein [Kingella negevensis]
MNKIDRTPMVLLPYQQRWIADQNPVKICEKSRRIGLSWGEAADSALLAAQTNGMNVWYIGYNKDMALEFIHDCGNWAKFYGLAADEVEQTEEVFMAGDDKQAILAFVIRFASGWRITALSSRPNNLRGKQGRVIIDEAAFHDDLPELLKAAMALLMWGGQVHIISTHDGVDNVFNELINDCRAEKKPYSVHRITFEDAISDGLYKRICLRLGKDWTAQAELEWVKEIRASYGEDASEELDCIPKNGGGKWLNRALIESRMTPFTPVIRYDQSDEFGLLPEPKRAAEVAEWLSGSLKPFLDVLDGSRKSFIGVDFARSGDRTAIVPLIQQQDLILKTPFIVELGNMPFKQQEQICQFIFSRLPNLLGAALDARGNGQSLAESMQDTFGGDRVQAVMLSENWYRSHTAPFKAALEDDTLDGLPRDEDILNDLRAFELVKGVPRIPDTRTKGQDGKKRHGDTAIALLLAHFASREMNIGAVRVSSRATRNRNRLTQGF